MEEVNTLVIGAGQAGLSISYHLTQTGREHLVLEKKRIGKAWRDERWDSFTLVTPNRTLRLPGMEYRGDNSGGSLTREEMVDYLDRFVKLYDPPVRESVEIQSLESDETSPRLIARTSAGDILADNAVVAAGTFQKPRIPTFKDNLSPEVFQLHTSEYRNPDQLPAGAVLVVGSGQSGCQIAEELYQARAGGLPLDWRRPAPAAPLPRPGLDALVGADRLLRPHRRSTGVAQRAIFA